ncbi:MAG: 1-deoxy-D-xylulose-5-phosphate reductoisomerase [Bacilli bacterium]|nr:1-deoxy-D-xylulose-5-phosphate reductoisomerase [Bacilli bacterium]
MEKLLLLGASGSIGTQTLSFLKKAPNDFLLVGFSVGKRTRSISYLIKKYPSIRGIYMISNRKMKEYQKRFPHVKFFSGEKGILDLIDYTEPTLVENALVGFSGLVPTIHALKKNLKVALANKETLVVGGELVNELLFQGHGSIYPIDSEHSAIWKCLKVDDQNVDKMIITASGGAFRKLNRDELKNVTAKDALAHPTWKMGAKITIDCATMVNKSFEIIEAHYLFNYPIEKIMVLLHEESHIHSMIKYHDGTYRAEISKPDMRNPIRFALYLGEAPFKTYTSDDYHKFGPYHFHDFDIKRYPIVRFASKVIEEKGTYGAVFNASNEEAVYEFLKGNIPFLAIEEIITILMNKHVNKVHPTLEDLILVDQKTREEVHQLIKEGRY